MIEEFLSKSEDKTLEFKENTTSLLGIIKTVIAFANTAGGVIVVGIQDKTKKIVGVANALDEEERLANSISDSIAPLIIPNIEIQTYRKKSLIFIHVPLVAGPFYLKSAGPEKGVFVRIGSTNRVADSNTVHTLCLYAQKISFDETPYPKMKTGGLNWDIIKKTFSRVNKKITERNAEDLGLLVEHLGKQCPSIGGTILFGINRLQAFPDAIIRCVRFLGDTKSRVLDHKDIDTYPVDALEEAIHFVEKNIRIGAVFGRMERIDVPEYPLIAIREALINAIIHADYSISGTAIMIAIFDDYLEITSPGGLPLGMTMERALAGSSRVRNRVIARTFRELNLTEQWGSGLQRIIDACTAQGLKTPKFEDFGIDFKVTLYATQELCHPACALRALAGRPGPRSGPIPNSEEKKIVAYIKKQKKISTKEAAVFWHIAPRNAREKLKRLVAAGIVKRVGTSLKDPHGGYVLS
jgi:predicted HTH transcriptional regulator